MKYQRGNSQYECFLPINQLGIRGEVLVIIGRVSVGLKCFRYR